MDPVKLSDIKMETVAPFDGKHSEKLMLLYTSMPHREV